MASNAATRLLLEWNVSDEVIANFTAQEIDVEQFNILTEEDLKNLIPNIGPRRKFQSKVQKYFSEIPQSHMQETSLQQEKCVNINSVEDNTLEQQILRAIIVEDTKEQNFNADIPNNSSLISTHEPLTIVTTPKQQNFNADIPNNSPVISTSEILTIVTTPKQNFNADIPNNNSLRSPETVNTVTPVLSV
ncbi:uncharacterized protein LOC112467045 [Temnothorax curvispinosus]|uniref:Uncharacterized protein LOC112467045 n=1 Tax=Temnothorax curvispinosus TaxID=300111 RepID=A0A6J1RAL1_9HYME|nr:uncharacterized protein LOC112467045 [Temnothorax curvispinosus]